APAVPPPRVSEMEVELSLLTRVPDESSTSTSTSLIVAPAVVWAGGSTVNLSCVPWGTMRASRGSRCSRWGTGRLFLRPASWGRRAERDVQRRENLKSIVGILFWAKKFQSGFKSVHTNEENASPSARSEDGAIDERLGAVRRPATLVELGTPKHG